MTDCNSLVQISKSTNASTIAAAEASAEFRTEINSVFTTGAHLTDKEKLQAERMLGFKFRKKGSYYVKNDHPVLHVIRQFVRQIYARENNPLHTKVRTLCVGSSMREFKEYNSNPNISYHLHLSEFKDITRTVTEALEDVSKSLAKRISSKDKRIFIDCSDTTTIQPKPAIKRYKQLGDLMDDLAKLNKLPPCFHTEITENYNTLLFEDSIYNFDREKIVEIFSKTQANVAYGYALLPWELFYKDMPESSLYRVHNFKLPNGKVKTSITFRGYNSGYCHNYQDIITLFKDQVICTNRFNLDIEINSRVGPFCTFTIRRTNKSGHIVREMSLPEDLHYVKILDFFSSVDISSGKVRFPLKYISIFKHEYNLVMEYLLKLKPESVTVQNTLMYISRLREGINLINNELISPWHLKEADVYPVAFGIYMQALLVVDKTELIESSVAIGSVWEKFKRFFFRMVNIITLPLCLVKDLIHWVMSQNLVGKIVKYPVCEEIQYNYVPPPSNPIEPNLTLNPVEFTDPRIPTCPLCASLHGKLGKQKILCKYKHNSQHTFKMDQDKIDKLVEGLIDNDEDPIGLKTVKERANKNMVQTEFSWTVNINYIRGGPGTGKSYIIRKLLRPGDLVIAPFTKLRKDYAKEIEYEIDENANFDIKNYKNMNVNRQTKTGKFEPLFKTNHRAIANYGAERIFLDEFSSFDLEFLAVICYLNGCTQLFIVGDHNQTKIRAGEGSYIGDDIDLESVSTHELRVNFRNKPDTVALLNRLYGYNMESAKYDENYKNLSFEEKKSIKYVNNQDLMSNHKLPVMSFSHMTGVKNSFEKKNTVRQNQGQSLKTVGIVIGEDDANLVTSSELMIVALSRHEETLHIALNEETDVAGIVRDQLKYDAEFINNLDNYLPIHDELEKLGESEITDIIAQTIISPIDSCNYSEEQINQIITDSKLKTPVSLRIKFDQSGILAGANMKSFYYTRDLLAKLLKVANIPLTMITGIYSGYKFTESTFNLISDTILSFVDEEKLLHLLSKSRGYVKQFFVAVVRMLVDGMSSLNARMKTVNKKTSRKSKTESINVNFKTTCNNFIDRMSGIKLNLHKLIDVFNNLLRSEIEETLLDEEDLDISPAHKNLININRENRESLMHHGEEIQKTYSRVFEDYNVGEEDMLDREYEILKQQYDDLISSSSSTDTIVTVDSQEDVNSELLDEIEQYKPSQGKCFETALKHLRKRKFSEEEYYVYIKYDKTNKISQFNHIEASKPTIDLHLYSHISLSLLLTMLKQGFVFYRVKHKSEQYGKGKMQCFGFARDSTTDAFRHQITFFVPAVFYERYQEVALKEPEYRDPPLEQNPSDVFLEINEELPNYCASFIKPALNIDYMNQVENNFSNGCLSPEMFCPINERGHPKTEINRGYKLSAGYGLTYTSASSWQTLQVLQNRYLSKKQTKFYNEDAKSLAKTMVDEFFSEYMQPKIKFPDEYELHKIMDKYARDVVSRNYTSQAVGYELDTQIKTVRFFLKNIFKPGKKNIDLTKVGQGISAWSKDAQLLFGAAARITNFMICKNSLPNYIYDNHMTEDQLIERVNTEYSKIPSIATNGVVDFGEFDSNQNRFTQDIERNFISRLGISQIFSEMYYFLRNNYTIRSEYVSGKAGSVKPSGEPFTLPGNTTVSSVKSNYILRGKGNSVVLGKGDDTSKRQMDLKIDQDRLEDVKKYVNFNIKIDLQGDIEFCGNTLSQGQLIPCLLRKLKKISGHSFRDYKHFTEYQISLRDFIKRIRALGINKVLAVNVGISKSYENALHHLYLINSFSHINESQYNMMFKEYKFQIDNRYVLY